jgi:hypothetical protein
LGRKQCKFKSITSQQVVTVLWHVFMDARQFFSTTVNIMGALLELNLRVTRGMIETMMIPEQMNVPYHELLGAVLRDNPMGPGGQESFKQPWANHAIDAPVGQRYFSRVPGPIKSALSGAHLLKYRELRIADVMAAATLSLRYSAIRPDWTCCASGLAMSLSAPTSTPQQGS